MKRLLALCALLAFSASCPACFTQQLTGRPYPCDPALPEDPVDGGNRPDGGSPQCALGWRCGLEKTCHERGVEQPYLCTDDSWCEGTWECGADGICAALIFDGLRADAGLRRDGGTGALSIQRVSPVLLDRMPDTFAAAQDVQVGPSEAFHGSGVAWTVGNRYELLARSRLGPAEDPIVGQYEGFHFYANLPGTRVIANGATASLDLPTLVMTDQGVGSVLVDFDGGGSMRPAQYQPLWPDAGGTQLRIFDVPPAFAFAFDERSLAVLEYPSFGAPGPPMIPPPRGGRPLLLFVDAGTALASKLVDITHVHFVDDTVNEKVVLVGTLDDRLWFAQRGIQRSGPGPQNVVASFFGFNPDSGRYEPTPGKAPAWVEATLFPAGGSFDPLSYDGGYLIDDRAFIPGRLRARGPRIAVEMTTPSAPPTVLLTQLQQVEFQGQLSPFLGTLMGPCVACPAGWSLTDFAPLGQTNPRMEARCQAADGGFLTVTMFPATGSAGCSSELVRGGGGPLRDLVLPQTVASGHGGWAGAHGQLWVGESLFDARAVVLDGPPQALVSADGLVAAVSNRTLYFLTPDAGFLAMQGVSDDVVAPRASVQGKDEWMITRDGVVVRRPSGMFGNAGGAVVAAPDLSVDPRLMGEPYHAGIGRSPDGGALVVFSSNDALFSADVSRIYREVASHPGGPVSFRIVPLTRVAIRSLAVMDTVAGPDGGVPYAHAYVLAREELYEVTATSEAIWRSRAVATPPGRMVEVWADGEFARLGAEDGKVYSLPTLKLLAPALADAVLDYYPFRGEAWALTARGLWQLQPPDAGYTGAWVPGPDTGEVDFTGGAMFEANDALYVFTGTGWVYRVR